MDIKDKWKKVLDWKTIPEFGPIHKLSEERFKGCYYTTESINEVIERIVSSIKDGYGFNHKTIIAERGCGKTTFLYYLKATLDGNKDIDNYHLEIIHMHRLCSDGDDYKVVIAERTISLLGRYFSTNNLQDVFETLNKGGTASKIIINNIEDYIVNNKDNFKKKLIVIIDDIDETDEEIAEPCVRYFHSLLECEQVAKWLVARATTLQNYHASFLDFIETKFAQRIVFPKVELFGILNQRIMYDNPEGINPFIPELCRLLLTTYNNDLRVAVTNAVAFIEHLTPPKSAKNNPSFAGHFFRVNFTKVMSEIGVFPNIYIESISKLFPVEKDVFLFLALKNRFDSADVSILEKHYKDIYANKHRGQYEAESHLISLDTTQINEAIYYLSNHRLIMEHSRIKKFYKLTSRGESFVKFIREKVYTERCKVEADSAGDNKHPVFWELAYIAPRM